MMNSMMRSFFLVLCCVFLAGCGGDAASVIGTVKLADGTPLTSGFVTFESSTTNVVGYLDERGRFSLFQARPGDRVPPGTYRGAISYDTTAAESAAGMQEEGVVRNFLPFPSKYTSFETSGLTLTVEPRQKVQLDIVLE